MEIVIGETTNTVSILGEGRRLWVYPLEGDVCLVSTQQIEGATYQQDGATYGYALPEGCRGGVALRGDE